jgi:uncharacterized protein Yka (UPF0111/DUF47 family)
VSEKKAEIEELEEELDQVYSDIADELKRAEHALDRDLLTLLDHIDEMGRWCDELQPPEGHAEARSKCFEMKDKLLEIFRNLCADFMRVSKAKLIATEKMGEAIKKIDELLEELQ